MSETAAVADPRYAKTREQPPVGLVGPWAWAKANLFSSWWSTAITLLLAYFIIRIVSESFAWAVLHAVWSVPYGADGKPDTTVCQNARGIGACWAIITEKYRLILF